MNRHEFAVRDEPLDLRAIASDCIVRHEAQADFYGIEPRSKQPIPRSRAERRALQALSNLARRAPRLTAGRLGPDRRPPGSAGTRTTAPG